MLERQLAPLKRAAAGSSLPLGWARAPLPRRRRLRVAATIPVPQASSGSGDLGWPQGARA